MKVKDVRLVTLRTMREAGSLVPAWDPGRAKRFRWGGGSYLEVRTDEGLAGIGPALGQGLLGVVRELLVGTHPLDVETHSARLVYALRGNPRAVGSVDIALWDLLGKARGQPLHRLWGGSREDVPVYASTIQLLEPERAASLAAELREDGWRALKLRLHHETPAEDVATVEAVRAAVGDTMTIMADANQAQGPGTWQPGVRWDFDRALATARALERLGCAWLEEPLPRYAWDELAELNRRVELPIAGGENNAGLHEFRWMMERGVYDIVQPDSLVCGGITALRAIGALAADLGKNVVPHHGGGALGTVAHLHLAAAWPHAPYLEILHEPPVGSYRNGFSIFANPPVVDASGRMKVPDGPGLGVEIDPDLVEPA